MSIVVKSILAKTRSLSQSTSLPGDIAAGLRLKMLTEPY